MINQKYILIIFIAIFLVACHSTDKIATDQESVEIEQRASLSVKEVLATNKNVKIGRVQTKIIDQQISCTGKIAIPKSKRIAIHSKIEGYVESMRYAAGDYVKKGAVLFSISNPNLIEKQRILLETKAKLSLAEKDYERKKILQTENATSQKTFDEVYAQKELLTAQYKGLKSELKLIGINVESLEKTDNFQSSIVIYALQAGYVSELLVNRGQMISPEVKLAELTDNADVYVELQVHPKDINLLEKGQKIQFYIPNNSMTFGGTITKLNPTLNAAGTLTAYCTIDAKQKSNLKAGTFVNAAIEVKAQEVKGIPLDAVIKEGEAYFAYLVEGNLLNKKMLKNVEIIDEFVLFEHSSVSELVVEGAYYIE